MTDTLALTLSDRRRRIALGAILAAAFALRLAHWAAVRGEPFVAQLVVDSKEYDAWARQIAGGDWLGSRVFFQAPLYPYALASIYSVAGHRLDVVYLLQIVAAVAGVGALYRAGRAMGSDAVGLVAAGLAAAYGPFLFYDVQILKESFAVTAASFLLWAVAAARSREGARLWGVSGLLLGLLALLRENALLATPFVAALSIRRGVPARTVAWRCGALALGVALPLVPVAVRNGLVGGDYLPTTSQGGANVFIGNNAAADGTYRPIVPGKQVPALERLESTRVAEVAMGRALSPAEVSTYWMGQALAWARAHPWDFARLQVRKLGMYWSWYEWPDAVDYAWMRQRSWVYRLPLVEFSSVSLLAIAGLLVVGRRRLLDAFAPAWVFAAIWMLSTIVFFLFSRYRLPGIPALMLLAAAPLVALGVSARRRDARWWLGATLAGAALALSLVPAGQPRLDLVEFNLGRLAQERGDDEDARRHYEAVLAVEPKSFLACLNLGTIAAGRQDWPAALDAYRRAAALEPRSDDAACDLGGVLLAMGRADEAAVELDRALALNPRNTMALQNKAVLLLRRGDVAGARALNERLLEIDPASPPGLRMKARLSAAN